MTGLFKEDVTSSNVVGYQKLTLGAEFNWVAPMFLTVGGRGINIQQIQLDFGEGSASGGDNIQILDEGGATIHTYNWMPAEVFGTAGWVAEDFSGLASVVIEKGQSVLIECMDSGTVAKVYGEVSETDYVTESVAGFNFVGNTTPVTINVQEIQLDFGEGSASGGDNIQILDEGGATIHTYNWMPAEVFGTAGWVEEDFSGLATFTIPAGSGILIECMDDGTTITVPAAL